MDKIEMLENQLVSLIRYVHRLKQYRLNPNVHNVDKQIEALEWVIEKVDAKIMQIEFGGEQ